MKDYYDILDVPLTATADEIKARYRQLVRVYHPDRFTNLTDKEYAEQKLKEINEAYAALIAYAGSQRAPTPGHTPPVPIVEPATLDFGVIPPNRRTSARLQVGNIGGTARNVSFTYSDEQPWFTLTRGRQVYPNQPVPVEFEVLVNTAGLVPGQYTGWVEIRMDGATARAALMLEVGESAPVRLPLRWLLVGGLLILLLVALVVLTPLLQVLDSPRRPPVRAPVSTTVTPAKEIGDPLTPAAPADESEESPQSVATDSHTLAIIEPPPAWETPEVVRERASP